MLTSCMSWRVQNSDRWGQIDFVGCLRLLHGSAGPQRTEDGEARRRVARTGSARRRDCREGRTR